MLVRLFYDKEKASTNFELREEVEIAGFTIPIGFTSDRCKCPKKSASAGAHLLITASSKFFAVMTTFIRQAS